MAAQKDSQALDCCTPVHLVADAMQSLLPVPSVKREQAVSSGRACCDLGGGWPGFGRSRHHAMHMCCLSVLQSPPAPPRTQAYAEPYAGGVGDEYGAAWKVGSSHVAAGQLPTGSFRGLFLPVLQLQ